MQEDSHPGLAKKGMVGIQEKLQRYPDLVKRGIVNNRTTLDRWIRTQNFPRPVRLGPNSIAWRLSEVDDWIESRAK